MTAAAITTLLTAITGILIAGASYWFTKQREREAELRKEKLDHYKDFVASLSGVISGEATAEGQRHFARACNKLMLVAPQAVIEALIQFQNEIKVSNPNKSQGRHDELMSRLFYEIRRDLGIASTDDPRTFRVSLWASGQTPAGP